MFAAFASKEAKDAWGDTGDLAEPGADAGETEFDFRIGGHERFGFGYQGISYRYDARYYDIVPDQRIIYSYEMYADGARISVSVATIEFGTDRRRDGADLDRAGRLPRRLRRGRRAAAAPGRHRRDARRPRQVPGLKRPAEHGRTNREEHIMRTVIARIFDYSLDGVIATEGTSFFDFCRELPDDQAQEDRTRDFYEKADVHIMGRKHYQDAAQYFPEATDHPYADVMNAARKVVFSRTIRPPPTGPNTSVASGDLGAEIEKLKQDGDGYIVAHGGIGFWRSLIRRDLIDEYRVTLFPYLAGQGTRLFDDTGQSPRLELVSATTFNNGITELALRRLR